MQVTEVANLNFPNS